MARIGAWAVARRVAVAGALGIVLVAAAGSAAAAASRPPAEPVLQPGASGPAVTELWRILYRLHYVAGPTIPPTRYGAALQLGVRRFEWLNGRDPDPVVGRYLWRALEGALARHATLAPHASDWLVVVRESTPETASVYFDGTLVVTTPANTGVPGAATPTGVFFVYEKLAYQVMKGVDVDGVPYADPVHDIWYFVGGDAFHGFVRSAYGFPQSNGCVEVPPAVAEQLFPRMPVGTEVEVEP